MKRLIILICVMFLNLLMVAQNDSALYVKLRFHITKNFELKEDSISKKLMSEIFFVTFFAKENKLDSFSIWGNGNKINYQRLENTVQKSLKDLRRIEIKGIVLLPVIIYNIDERTLKSNLSRELQEYLRTPNFNISHRLNEKFIFLRGVALTQIVNIDEKKVY